MILGAVAAGFIATIVNFCWLLTKVGLNSLPIKCLNSTGKALGKSIKTN